MARIDIGACVYLLSSMAFASPVLLVSESPGAGDAERSFRAAVFRTPEGPSYTVYQAENVSKGGTWALVLGVSPSVRVDSVWNALFPALDESTAPWLEERVCDGSASTLRSSTSIQAFAKQDAPTAIELFADATLAGARLASWGLSSKRWGVFVTAAAKIQSHLLVVRFDAAANKSMQSMPLRFFEPAPTKTIAAAQVFGDIGQLQSWSFGDMPVAWDSIIEHRVSDSRIPTSADPIAAYEQFISSNQLAHIEARDSFSTGLRPFGWPAVVPALDGAIGARAGALSAECASALAKAPCAPGDLFAMTPVVCSVPASCAPYSESAWFGAGYVTRAVLSAEVASTSASEYASALDVVPLVAAADCQPPPSWGGSATPPRASGPPQEQDPNDYDDRGDAVGSAACAACLSAGDVGSAGCKACLAESDGDSCSGGSGGDSCSGSDGGSGGACGGGSGGSSGCGGSGSNDCHVSRSKRKVNYLSRFSLGLLAVALLLRRRYRPVRDAVTEPHDSPLSSSNPETT